MAHTASKAGFQWWNPRIQVTAEVRKKVEEFAIAERRSLANMLSVLIEEAIEAREDHG